MSGLYIHIPFCKSRCIYCGFYSTTREDVATRYVDALCREMELRNDYIAEPPSTIYLGGGTPSRLCSPLLIKLFAAMDTFHAQEITVECNPDDITDNLAQTLKQLRVNRVSMGAQTFNDDRLRFLRRRHNAADVRRAVSVLRAAGIKNISIDLMYGFPGETLTDWLDDIKQALSLTPEHISAYCLSYERGTVLRSMLDQGCVAEADEENCRAMFYTLDDRLSTAGYDHYEISNFALPGYRSMHNSSYWTGAPYIGIGAAAHSFDGNSRQWNIADIDAYMDSVEKGMVPAEREELDDTTHYNDTVMLSLRMSEGIDMARLTSSFGSKRAHSCIRQAQKYIDSGLLELSDHHLRLTHKGLFVSDMVMSDLMEV